MIHTCPRTLAMDGRCCHDGCGDRAALAALVMPDREVPEGTEHTYCLTHAMQPEVTATKPLRYRPEVST